MPCVDKYRESFAKYGVPRSRPSNTEARPPVHTLEKLLAGVISALLVFLPWAFGGVHNWANYVALSLSSIAFVVALIPRVYASPDGSSFKLVMWPKLVRFPIFWLGLIFFAYVGIQMANPSWTMVRSAKGAWWLQAAPFVGWLPHGVGEIPDSLVSPWISLLSRIAAFLLVCAAWVGVTRRRSILFLFNLLIVNATLLACFSLVQRLAGFKAIYGVWQTQVSYFVGPFIYKNHAGAYFNLLIAITAALALYHYLRTARTLDKSTPSLVYLFMGLLMGATVFISYSRAASFLLIVYVVLLGVFLLVERIRNPRSGSHPAINFALLGLMGVFLWVGVSSLKLEKAWERAQALFEKDRTSSVEYRAIAAKATMEMAADAPWSGHGQGSFRFVFPAYQIRHPEIVGSTNGQIRLFWAHAHNDYVEALAELGILGLIPLAGMAAVWVVYLIRRSFWRYPPIWVLIAGMAVTAAHCWVDFQSHNPAIFVTWCFLLPCLIRWLEFEERRQ